MSNLTSNEFNKETVVNLKMEKEKVSSMIRSEFIASVVVFIILIFVCLFSVWVLNDSKSWNEYWFNEYGEWYQESYTWEWVFIIISFGLTIWCAYYLVTFKMATTKSLEEISDWLSKINSEDDYLEFKNWLVTDQKKFIRTVTRLSRWWGRKNGMAKGLLLGMMIF